MELSGSGFLELGLLCQKAGQPWAVAGARPGELHLSEKDRSVKSPVQPNMSGREEEQAGSESSRAAVTTLQTGWLLTDRHVFPTVLEAASLRSGHQRGQVLVRLLLGLQTSPRVLTWQKELGLWAFFHKSPDLEPRAPRDRFPEALPPAPSPGCQDGSV